MRRLLGLDSPRRDESAVPRGDEPDASGSADAEIDEGGAGKGAAAEPEPEPPAAVVACPYCGVALVPPPPRTRLCPSCRQRIVVRRVGGATSYLTQSAAAVAIAEQRRVADERAWSAARREWLRLAASVRAPLELRRKVAAMPLSDRAVEAARSMYRAAADQAAREAREGEQWVLVSRIRLAQAEALYADLGSPLPPPDDIVAIYREAKTAVLRSLAAHSPVAELAGTDCCRACRADDGGLFKIAPELRRPRLPHPGCPKGLCGCDWFVAVPDARPKRRRRRRAVEPAPGTAASAPAGDVSPPTSA